MGRAPSQPGAPIAAPPRGIPAGSPALPHGVGGSGAPVRLCQAGRRSRHGSYLGSGWHKTSCTGELGEVPGTGTVWGGAFSCPQLPPAPAPPAPSFAASTSPSPPGRSLPFDPAAPGTCWGGLPAPCAPRCPPLPAPLQRLLFIWAILFCCDPIFFFFFVPRPRAGNNGLQPVLVPGGGAAPSEVLASPLSLVPLPVPAGWASLAGKGSWQHLGSSAPNSRPGAELGRWSWL